MQLRIMENLQQKIFDPSFEFAVRLPKIKLKNITIRIHQNSLNRFFDTLMIQKEQLNC
jgi:hypothetical protein